MRVLVAGGGITGLTTAWALLSLARARGLPAQVTLVERDGRLGGKILTDSSDGFLVEAGPEAFISLKPAAAQLAEDLGIGDHVIGTRPEFSHTYIVRRGRLHPIPGGLTSFLPTNWWEFVVTRLVSLPGKMRMGLELFLPPRRPCPTDETMESFFVRRLGREAYAWLIEPLLSGIYAGDGSKLGLGATFPRYLEMERQYGGLVRAALAARAAARRAPPRPPGIRAPSMFQNLSGGLGEFTQVLEARIRQLGGVLMPATALDWLRPAPAHDGSAPVTAGLGGRQTWEGDAVVLALPAYDAADLVAPLDASLAERLREVRYVSTATISMAFDPTDMARRLDGYGFVVPRGENMQILASTWTSSKWANRAPDGRVLLRCYVGGDGRQEILAGSDDALLQRAWREMGRLMRFQVSPRRSWVHRWDRSMPQYEVGHVDRVRHIDAVAARIEGLYLAGAAYHGIGIPDCIKDARAVAGRIVDKAASGASPHGKEEAAPDTPVA